MATQRANRSGLQQHIDQFGKMVSWRLKKYFNATKDAREKWMPNITTPTSSFEEFIKTNKISEAEWGILMLGLLPHIRPTFLDELIQLHLPQPGSFPQIGGVRGKRFRGFLPSGETALFLLGEESLDDRFNIQSLFDADHLFAKKQVLHLERPPAGEPRMCDQIVMTAEFIERFTTEKVSRPVFSMNFPAQLIETKLEWNDLVLSTETFAQIKELETWIEYGNKLLNDWEMARKVKPGYRVLFYGPPGTGKTLTASLLGKYTGKDVYKIDLSMIVSKFIGETEKNLANLFAKAENKDWILFFDEADALFGKRTNVKDAHDKYANQEVSYLLQRVEDYNGLVILASNFKSNIDEAFIRRFQSIVHFPLPRPAERLQLWQNAFPKQISIKDPNLINLIAKKYELSGAEIINVVQHCCLQMLAQHETVVTKDGVLDGIRREYSKEGKIMR